MLFSDNVYDTSHSIASIQGTLRALYNLYAFYIVRVNESQVVLTTHIAVNTLSVDKDKNVVITEAVQLHLSTHIALSEGKGCSKST